MGPAPPAPEGPQLPAENPLQQPDLAADLFELQHIIPGLKRHRSPQINEQQAPELRPGFYGVGDGRERGKRPPIRFPLVRTVTSTIKRAQAGRNSRKDRRYRYKTEVIYHVSVQLG